MYSKLQLLYVALSGFVARYLLWYCIGAVLHSTVLVLLDGVAVAVVM